MNLYRFEFYIIFLVTYKYSNIIIYTVYELIFSSLSLTLYI